MKKVLFIGDVHGRSDWVNYATEALKAGQEVVFLGDYVDSFDQTGHQIEQNLLRIISFKKKSDNRKHFKTKVTLLLGNHDYSYISGKSVTGKDAVWEHRYYEIFNQNWRLFDVAWGHTDSENKYTLASHAGLTQTFWNKYVLEYSDFIQRFFKIDETPIHEILNILKDKYGLMWKVGSDRGGVGTPGILWADIRELLVDPFPNINQIVGHTSFHSPEFIFRKENWILKVDGIGKSTSRIIVDFK